MRSEYMDTEAEIQEMFQSLGMNPEKIRYNESLDYFLVNIGVEGTAERYLRDIHELGSAEPVDSALDTDMLRTMVSKIQGSTVPSGTVNVIDTMGDGHFRIEVD